MSVGVVKVQLGVLPIHIRSHLRVVVATSALLEPCSKISAGGVGKVVLTPYLGKCPCVEVESILLAFLPASNVGIGREFLLSSNGPSR
jgi:hypothetical protein